MLSEEGLQPIDDMLRFHRGDFTDLASIPNVARRALASALDAAFGADDDRVYPAGMPITDIVKAEYRRRGIPSAGDDGVGR